MVEEEEEEATAALAGVSTAATAMDLQIYPIRLSAKIAPCYVSCESFASRRRQLQLLIAIASDSHYLLIVNREIYPISGHLVGYYTDQAFLSAHLHHLCNHLEQIGPGCG
ncbi:hypothetical protein [Sphingorhabdus sp. SMR4y]|uniref:hypothetical protein n=1 Tax=Sphingorhabdus sp. SMR4y TaxID=2584094 RepID=UPI00163FAA2C|nr:hypothetical protein [Sphingorhabdus sp. SMR4y]